MFIVSGDKSGRIVKIHIISKGSKLDYLKVCSILSPEDEQRSFWGNITYEIHKSRIHSTHEGAKKTVFINNLS